MTRRNYRLASDTDKPKATGMGLCETTVCAFKLHNPHFKINLNLNIYRSEGSLLSMNALSQKQPAPH